MLLEPGDSSDSFYHLCDAVGSGVESFGVWLAAGDDDCGVSLLSLLFVGCDG